MTSLQRWHFPVFPAAALALTLLAAAPAGAESQEIGVVKLVEGAATVERDGAVTALMPGARLYRKDVISTGPDGALGVTFNDESRISLGPDSRLALKSFEFEPAQSHLSFVTELAHGTLQFISGVIAKLSPESVSVVTPVATIAVRGTRFAVRIPKPDDQ